MITVKFNIRDIKDEGKIDTYNITKISCNITY